MTTFPKVLRNSIILKLGTFQFNVFFLISAVIAYHWGNSCYVLGGNVNPFTSVRKIPS